MFGATPSFGAPASNPFGASTTPAFGASTTPAFGSTASTTPAFGASATPAFGATATSSTPFGAPSTNPFGTSTTPSFGATSATTTSTPFGASTNPFGASTTPSTSTPFGTTPTTTTPFGTSNTTSSNPFGTPSFSTPSATPSFSFSTAPATTPSFSTQSSFSSSFTTASATSSFLTPSFSSFPTAAQPALAPKPAEPNPIQKLQAIVNSLRMFNRFFYNYSAPRNPSDIPPGYQNDPSWNRAVMDNPDPTRLVPVQIIGFEGLKQRIEQQDKATAEHEQALDTARKNLDKISKELQSNTVDKLDEYKRRNVELKRKILDIMIKLEKLRSKGYPIMAEEDHFRARLESLRRELNQPTQYNGRLKELTSLIRMQDDYVSRVDQSIDSEDVTQIMKYLAEQKEGIMLLAEVLKKDSQDLEIMLNEYEKEQQS